MMNNFPNYYIQRFNLKIILGSILFIILSYILMYFGSKHNNEIVSLTIAPIMQLIGYITIIYALIKN